MEKRRHDRIDLQERGWRAELIDQMKGQKLGEIVNLSPGGLMLITSQAVEPENLYQVSCRATSPTGECHEFTAGVVVLWRTEASEKQTYWTGLQIIDIDKASRQRLRALSAAMAPKD